MSTPDRQELVRNAVVFLTDPKASSSNDPYGNMTELPWVQTQASPLAQRVQFLEAKGLTGPEIEEAMRQAAMSSNVTRAPAQPYAPSPYGPVYGPMPYTPVQPPPQQWDWRDYFVSDFKSQVICPSSFAPKDHCGCLGYHRIWCNLVVQGKRICISLHDLMSTFRRNMCPLISSLHLRRHTKRIRML